VLEFIISFTYGQDRCAAAIAEKSTACAAKIGHSGVTRPSSSQSLVGRGGGAEEVGCAVGGCCLDLDFFNNQGSLKL
jgi:hypothetical protein